MPAKPYIYIISVIYSPHYFELIGDIEHVAYYDIQRQIMIHNGK